jgi:hypothetical protein
VAGRAKAGRAKARRGRGKGKGRDKGRGLRGAEVGPGVVAYCHGPRPPPQLGVGSRGSTPEVPAGWEPWFLWRGGSPGGRDGGQG